MNLISHEYNILFSVCGGQSTISTGGQSNRVGVMKKYTCFVYGGVCDGPKSKLEKS